MPKPKLYTEASIQVAIEEVKNGASVRSTAKKYHISVSMLRKRCLQSQGLVQLGKRGRKPRLSAATEEKLATCIRQMAGLGFGPTLEELKVIVFDYLEANELGHVFDDKKPGDDWANNFMRRHKLSLKKAGFRATGIYPVDASKYKAERLDKVKLVSYNAWVAAGKPISDDGSPVLTNQRDDQHTEHANLEVSLTTPDDHHPSTSSTRITPATPLVSTDGKQNARRSLSFTSPGTSSSTTSLSSALDHASPQELVRALQKHAPPGMRYEISLVCKEDETSFEKIIKSRGRPSTSSQPQKRHKVSMHGAVISDEKFLQQQKEKESKKNTAKKKQAEVIKDSDTDSPSPIESDSSDLSDIDDENQDRLKKTVSRSLRRKELRAMLPEKKDIEKDMFYAVYYDKPCSYYWGRVEKILKETEDSEVSEVEMKFLKRSVPSSDPKCLRWDWPLMSDCEIVPVSHIFGGPATPIVENKSCGKPLFYFTEELKVFEMFKAASRYGFHSPKKDVH